MTPPSSPNIWYVANYAGGPGIGRHNRGWHLAAEWQRAGARATIITANNHHVLYSPLPAGPMQVDGISYEFLTTPPYSGNGIGRIRNMIAFTAAVARNAEALAVTHGKPDVVIASSPHPFAFLATHRIARRFGALSVLEVRDLWPLSLIELAGLSPWNPFVLLTGLMERYAYRSAHRIVSLLPNTADHMRSKGMPPGRWHYVPNGIDLSAMNSAPESPSLADRVKDWQQNGQCVVIYAGALGRPNNVESLISAMQILRDEGRPVRALIVGRGESEAGLKAQCAIAGLTGVVDFAGQVPREQALALMRLADVGFISLLPRPLFRFGISPNKLFDYMACGLPIVAALAAGNDPVTEAGCGTTVPPTDPAAIAAAISGLSKQPADARHALGLRGQAYVRAHHDYEVLAAEYMSCFGKLPRHRP